MVGTAPPVAPVLGGYVTIVNTGQESDRLVGGTTNIAERLEIHESSLVDGVAKMRPAKQGLEIAPVLPWRFNPVEPT
ncbi:copper chaperone PCu(A)C (plasmid) [Rhizobium oryzihabitans]|uniref:Copper chaperone PCu(A)C n=1 Tax=Rhizobium oryzihabitans TaxID=2267833 RepID=A0A7L5BRL3_9HYPH|nr:copper chaperone PCu(A)C [Rhizobium oryzihabitans]QIB41569.1 copper chaperone PCu(A)C [Rhizobium oryzihabitans]